MNWGSRCGQKLSEAKSLDEIACQAYAKWDALMKKLDAKENELIKFDEHYKALSYHLNNAWQVLTDADDKLVAAEKALRDAVEKSRKN